MRDAADRCRDGRVGLIVFIVEVSAYEPSAWPYRHDADEAPLEVGRALRAKVISEREREVCCS